MKIVKRPIFNLTRREVRYWLFRFRKEEVQSVPSNGSPKGLKAYFEMQKGFKTWKDFAVKWDIPNGEANEIVPLHMVRRKFSVWEEWQATMRSEVKVHPSFDSHEKVMDES